MKLKTRDMLCLDHFYIGFSKDEIRDFKKLLKTFKGSHYSAVSSGKESWEGFYLSSNIGSYFEALLISEDSPIYGFGTAFSGKKIQYNDVRKIKKEMPKIRWVSGTQISRNKKPWFDWLSVKSKKKDYLFHTWIMHYHFLDVGQVRKNVQYSIDRYKKVSVTMDVEMLSAIRERTAWLPGVRKISKRKCVFVFPERDSGQFRLEIILKKNFGRVKLNYLEMQLRPDSKIRIPQLRHFSLKKSGLMLRLARREK